MMTEHDWTMDSHDRIGNLIYACANAGCRVRKIENCSTFWQKAKGRKWVDDEDAEMPQCKGATP